MMNSNLGFTVHCCLLLLLIQNQEEALAWVPSPHRYTPAQTTSLSQRTFTRRHDDDTSSIQSTKIRTSSSSSVVMFYLPTVEEATAIAEVETGTSNASTVEKPKEEEKKERRTMIPVPMPKIQHTVPGMKRGWKDEVTGTWMDEDGPRNGPPVNYWRQQADERLHDDSMNFLQTILQQDADFFHNNDVMMNELVQPFERKNSIRRPFLHRSILGSWAPILTRNGQTVVGRARNNNNIDDKIIIDVPYKFQVQRTAGQKLGPKTPYGQFDEHLDPYEEITVTILEEEATKTSISSSSDPIKVSPDNVSMLVNGLSLFDDDGNNGPLYMGAITYVSKYMMIMRRKNDIDDDNFKESSPVTEIWMKIDDE